MKTDGICAFKLTIVKIAVNSEFLDSTLHSLDLGSADSGIVILILNLHISAKLFIALERYLDKSKYRGVYLVIVSSSKKVLFLYLFSNVRKCGLV